MPERIPYDRKDRGFDYWSTRWRQDRKLHIETNPLCEECKRQGRVTPAIYSDHIRPIKQGGDPWDWANRQALCKRCHDIKSAKEAHTTPKGGEGG